jgi:hypothetical protein
MEGRKLATGKLNPGKNEVNINSISQGIYIFQLYIDGNGHHQRLVIE